MRKLAVAAICGAVFYCFLTVPALALNDRTLYVDETPDVTVQ